MSETTSNQNDNAGATEVDPQFLVNAQYVKDLSFENPNAPSAIMQGGPAGDLNLTLNVQVQQLNAELYEVVLDVRAEARRDGSTLFIAEVSYAGLFTLRNIARPNVEAVLFIEAPRLLFPFAREIIATVTRDGGFPPVLINPVDFVDLYRRRLAQRPVETETVAQA